MTTEMKQIDADKLAAEIAGLSAPDLRKLLLVEVRQHEDTKRDLATARAATQAATNLAVMAQAALRDTLAQRDEVRDDLEAARAEAAEGEANGRAEAEARLGAVIRENNAGIENLRDDLEASAATAELYRTAAEQAAKERDEALNVAHAQAHAAVEDMRLQRDEARRERDLVGQSFERAGAELLRIEADRDEARALAKDAQDGRERLAVEVQALREALRRIGALHSETRTGIRGEPKGETWSAFADRLQREAVAALSAPSESERVLAARDERAARTVRSEMRAWFVVEILGGALLDGAEADAKTVRAVLADRDERTRDAKVVAETEAHYVALLDGEPADVDAGVARAILRRAAKVRAAALETMRVAVVNLVVGEAARLSRATLWNIAECAFLQARDAIAATPPSAASAPDCTLTVEDAVGTGNPSAASGKPSAVCPKYPDGKHRFTPYTCACLACIGDVPPSAAIGKCATCGGSGEVSTGDTRRTYTLCGPCPTCAASGKGAT
jgi:hypothetical protein